MERDSAPPADELVAPSEVQFLHDQIAELTRQLRNSTVRDKSPLPDHPKDSHVDDAHARASLVTVQSMNEMRWSFKVP
ncbi:hypothetical protein BROUX41_001818 [Berkeleyomyces rouxiae]|uniref:uncharacterized protein n=1 Tax=Berkeleyomyces rouxiae TaxID=2035830 RepID=UPI003B779C58